MNDTIHHDGKGGFETESFRSNSSRVSNTKEIEVDGVKYFLTTPFFAGLTNNIIATKVHFLDTPAGRDWDNIVEWKKAQKVNKTKK